MASSVARMPADDWRDPGRLPGSIFGAHAHNPFLNNGLRKIFVRGKASTNNATTTSSSSLDSSINSNGAKNEQDNAVKETETNINAENIAPVIASTVLKKIEKNENETSSPSKTAGKRKAVNNSRSSGEEGLSPPNTAKHRQSQILNRWAARQAREMVTTIERQAHEAELSDLTTKTMPVAARAASFLRETSPSSSESSSTTSPFIQSPLVVSTASNANVGDIVEVPKNVRASSLIQMWRELEAEAGMISTTPRLATATSAGANSITSSVGCFAADEPPMQSEGFDDSEWDSDSMTLPSSANSSLYSSLNEGDRKKVSNIVKMLTLANRAISDVSSIEENIGTPGLELSPAKLKEQRNDEELVAKMEQERKREVAALATQFCVSQYSYRGRLQSMIRLRCLRRQVSVQDELRSPSTTLKLGVQDGETISFLRERFNNRERKVGRRKASLECLSSLQFQFPMDSEGSGYVHSGDQFTSCNNQRHLGTESQKKKEIAIPGTSLPNLKNDEIQVGNQSPASSSDERPEAGSPNYACDGSNEPNGSWDERNLWMNSMDWQRSAEASTSSACQGEVINQELESHHQLNEAENRTLWEGESSDPLIGWSARRQPFSPDLFGNLSDNEEIRELLERRKVSTSLSSNFSEKMNQMILSFVNRIQQQQYYDNNYTEEYAEQSYWGQKDGLENAEQITPALSSLVPLPLHQSNQTESWQNNSLIHYPFQNRTDLETMQCLRSDVQQIREELSELRALVKSFVEYQGRYENSIKQEISDTIRQSGNFCCNGNSPLGRKANCCICNEKQVDSLLYRCGHMCTCYKCAYELQWGSGKCPICRLPIEDIVRVSEWKS